MFKEIQVSQSFLGIDENDRRCQSRELYDECIQHAYVDRIRKFCGCLPLSIKLNTNVDLI